MRVSEVDPCIKKWKKYNQDLKKIHGENYEKNWASVFLERSEMIFSANKTFKIHRPELVNCINIYINYFKRQLANNKVLHNCDQAKDFSKNRVLKILIFALSKWKSNEIFIEIYQAVETDNFQLRPIISNRPRKVKF